jgi:UDP-glucose 4-epimerase
MLTGKRKIKKILITGGSGFVGKNIIHQLKNRRYLKIYNLSKDPFENIKNVKNLFCDALTYDFSELNTQFDYIINLLALSNEKYCDDFLLAEKINIDFTKKVLDFARSQKKLRKFIHMSSIIIYNSKNNPPVKENAELHLNYTTYSFTKGISEQYVKYYQDKFKIPALIFRLSNIYGPYQEYRDSPFLVPSKIFEALKGEEIKVLSLKPKRDWIFSEDAARAIVKGLNSGCEGIYNLASGRGISVKDIMKEISNHMHFS